jgi:hypothetical protein
MSRAPLRCSCWYWCWCWTAQQHSKFDKRDQGTFANSLFNILFQAPQKQLSLSSLERIISLLKLFKPKDHLGKRLRSANEDQVHRARNPNLNGRCWCGARLWSLPSPGRHRPRNFRHYSNTGHRTIPRTFRYQGGYRPRSFCRLRDDRKPSYPSQ